MQYRNSREVVGEVRNVTVSQSCGKWYVSIQTEYEATEPQHESTSIVGLDAGVTNWPRFQTVRYTRPSAVLKSTSESWRLQRKLSRKIKFSANWQNKSTKFNVCILHCQYQERLPPSQSHQRNQQKHAMIVIEDLKVNNMSNRPKVILTERPGRERKS